MKENTKETDRLANVAAGLAFLADAYLPDVPLSEDAQKGASYLAQHLAEEVWSVISSLLAV